MPLVKTCRCGKSYDAHAWRALTYVGVQPGGPADEHGPAYPDVELRNCSCGSTLAVEGEESSACGAN